ncbi:MAG: hypothetical protein DCC50_15215 [Acidobacteria bacterium]|nr:MAG: hypothetical protein DCC50_15215 [Acidobacteriota bacterium]
MAPRRLTGALVALWCLLPFVLLSGPASGAPPASSVKPTGVVATMATTQPGVGGALPAVLAQAGVTPITLTLTLEPAGSTFPQDATFALDVSLAGGGTPAGDLSRDAVVLPRGETSGSWTVTYSAVDNGVVVTPRMTTRPPKDFTSTPAAPFQSLKRVTTTQAGPGAAVTVGTETCGPASTDVACATVFLSQGSTSALAVTTVGACTPDLGCPEGSEVVGFIADLGTTYTREAPAQITIRCDASRCGNGGVNSYVVHMSFEADGPLDIVSQPCIAKGVADDGQGHDFCTDYVSSTRDGGDLLLVVNVLHDYRGAV